MGLLVDGVWHTDWYETKSTDGEFKRQESAFRNWITTDGSAGPTGESGFKAESGRYHLYICHACPWAHRTMIFRNLKGLEDHIDVSVVHPDMMKDGWSLDPGYPGATG
ncbi:MAG: glutathione S-transferase family protein, partial [Roseovarius sp.]|nr:glutathione S-transferase family protein [Roseovarius sp.]